VKQKHGQKTKPGTAENIRKSLILKRGEKQMAKRTIKLDVTIEGKETLEEFIEAVNDLNIALNRLTKITNDIDKIEVGFKTN
jgi:predicted DNA-binding protein